MPKLKPHGGHEQEGDLESQHPWIIQMASFNKEKTPIASSLPSPSPVSLGLVTGSVSYQELCVPIPKMRDHREKAQHQSPQSSLSFPFRKGGAPGSLLSKVFPDNQPLTLVGRWGGQNPPIVTSRPPPRSQDCPQIQTRGTHFRKPRSGLGLAMALPTK